MGLGFGDWVFGVCLGFVGDWGLGVSRMSCGDVLMLSQPFFSSQRGGI